MNSENLNVPNVMPAEIRGCLILDYLYCDGSNYKAFGSIRLIGNLTDAERTEVIECLDSGEFFVAEQVGVPPMSLGDNHAAERL